MRTSLFTLLLLLTFSTGCASKQPVTVSDLARSQQCQSPHTQYDITVVQEEDRWATIFSQQFASGRLPAPKVPDIDLSLNHIILIDLGQKSTTGHGISLFQESAVVENGLLTITVKITSPDSTMMHAQMMTHPCLALKVPKGDYEKVSVVDQQGLILAEVTVNR